MRRQNIAATGNEVGEIAEIYVLYIDPSFQGLGIGTAILERVAGVVKRQLWPCLDSAE